MKTVGLISPAGGGVSEEKINSAKKYFENRGFQVKLSKNIYASNRYLAGKDDERLEELHSFFKDPDIGIIISTRGGYGSIRIINGIDYDLIKNNPKIFCGYSDITALLLMIYKKTGLITYHGPMASTDFSDISTYTEENFLKAISGEKLEFNGNKVYKEGSASGIIWGGNLATVVTLCGQDFIPNQDFIFFAEDLNEPVYKIDRMFTQLFNIKEFKNNCKGIILGDFLDTDNEDWLEELFKEFEIPTISGLKITHNKDKITIPIGRKCYLENTKLVID